MSCSEETKKKIAAARRGRQQSEETKSKISQTMSNRSLSMGHRFRISESKRGKYHSEETRGKISESVHRTKTMLRREKLASRAAAAAEAATADIREPYRKQEEEDEGILDMIELERAVIEVTRLRDQLTTWMDLYETRYGKKPDLTETSETHPHVYGTFARYVALRELVRQSSLKIGFSPVSWV